MNSHTRTHTQRCAHFAGPTCTVWDLINYGDPSDFNYASGSGWHVRGSYWDIRGGDKHLLTSATLKEKVDFTADIDELQVTWRFSLGFCQEKLGQGTAPVVSLVIGGTQVWRSSIDLATEDISGDGHCGGDGWVGGSMSPPKTFSVDVKAMTGEKSLQFKFQNTDRNIHFKLDKIVFCSQPDTTTLTTTKCTSTYALACIQYPQIHKSILMSVHAHWCLRSVLVYRCAY